MEVIWRTAERESDPSGLVTIPSTLLTTHWEQLDDELQSLEAAGIQRLVPEGLNQDGTHIDRAFELKRLAKSLLLNFLELVGIMSHNPSQVGSPTPFPNSS